MLVAMLTTARVLRAQVSVIGSTVLEQQAAPGTRYTASFVISNSSTATEEARLYQTDYSTDASGSNAYGPPGSLARSNAHWIALGTPQVVLAPRSTRTVTVAVDVPRNDALQGTYWSMIMVEAIPRGSAASMHPSATHEVEVGVRARIRYAVQVVTDIGASAKRDAAFQAPLVFALGNGSRVLQFDVRNTGLRAFPPAFSVELYDQRGTLVTSGKAVREIMYPGTSLRQRFDLGHVAAGRYRAIVTMDAGDDVVLGAQYNLTL